jgi:hypothetical protein
MEELIKLENKLAMEELIRQHDLKKADEQNKLIESFKKQLKMTQKPKSHFSKKMMDNCFEKCREFAMGVVLECTLMSIDDIVAAFSSKDKCIDPNKCIDYPTYNSYYWYNNIKRDQNNIPFPAGMEIPKRRDHQTGNLVDINFSVSKFYSDPAFIKKCNDYYVKFNLNLSIQKEMSNPKYRNNWKLTLSVGKGNYIIFNQEKFNNICDPPKPKEGLTKGLTKVLTEGSVEGSDEGSDEGSVEGSDEGSISEKCTGELSEISFFPSFNE